jgi:glutamate racemase
MIIGVFDSGRGATFIAERLRAILPEHEYIIADDSEHVPYGTRSQAEIITLTDHAIQPLLSCPIIVIACNTITTAAINTLRKRYPSTHFIGLEPMVKPAGLLTHSGHIIVLATPYTLSSERYKTLKQLHAVGLIVDEPMTGKWPRTIEDNAADTITLDEVKASYDAGADVIVLGCTHYLALIPRLTQIASRAIILEPSEAIARRIRQISARP